MAQLVGLKLFRDQSRATLAALQHKQGSDDTSWFVFKGCQSRMQEIEMEYIDNQARAFFTKEEYALYIEEVIGLFAAGDEPYFGSTCYLLMLQTHDEFGIERKEMRINDGKVSLTLKGAKQMAMARLRQSDVTPDLQDQIMDMISFFDRHAK